MYQEYTFWFGKPVNLMYVDDNQEPVVSETGPLTGLKIETHDDGSCRWDWARIGDTWYPLGWLELTA